MNITHFFIEILLGCGDIQLKNQEPQSRIYMRVYVLTKCVDFASWARYLLAGQPYRMELQSQIQVLKQDFQELYDKNLQVLPSPYVLCISIVGVRPCK